MRIFCDVFLVAVVLFGRVATAIDRSVNSTDLPPPPLEVAPSQYWDGVDGQWSSFALRIGEPAQSVRVVVSTNSPQSMVVLPVGCTTMAVDPVPADCANSRGGTFAPNNSKTWDDQGLFGINNDGVGLEADLGYLLNADYGLETIGLGYSNTGLALKNQTVAGFGTASPLYIGLFGLGTQPVNYTTIGNFSAPSFFTSLREQKLIPSLSWSYTAGAKYRLKAGQLAQLIFGGYDTSRFVSNGASFSLAPDVTRDIVVAIQSITYSGTTQSNLLSSPTFAFIESTDPNFWLPEAACQQFEKAFGLSIDNATGLYLINSTHYANLKGSQAQVTFTLANSLSGGDTVEIILPFDAFALPASYPFTKNDTFYFPLRKANNDTQTTLGRAFLQEAYLTVDYERGNFSVSQCLWDDGATPSIASIVSSSYPANNSSSDSSPPSSKAAERPKAKLGAGAIAGIVIAVIIALGAAAGLAYFLLKRRKRPVSKVPTEDINLNPVSRDKDATPLQSPSLPAPVYKKDATEDSYYMEDVPRIELSSATAEIYQLPDRDNREGDYFTAAREMRAANTAEVAGDTHFFELPGDTTASASELDDEASRRTLSRKASTDWGRLSPRTPDTTRGSPRLPSPMSPFSPFSGFSDP